MGKIKSLFIKISNFLIEKIKNFLDWIRKGEAFLKIKTFFHVDRDENSQRDHAHKQLYVIIVFAILLVAMFLFTVIPDIYNRNVSDLIKPAFLIIGLVIFLVVWIIFAIMYSIGLYVKDVFLWFLISIPLFLMYKFNNIPSKTISIISLVIILVTYPLVLKNSEKPRLWFWTTILIMILSLFSGIALIDTIYGNNYPVALSLNIDGNIYNKYAGGRGQVYCNVLDEGSESLIGKNLTCFVKPQLNILNAKLTITTNGNETKSIDLINNNYTFLAEENTDYLYFEILGTNKKGREIFVSSGGSPQYEKYYPLEERKSRLQEFVKYLGILFTAVFVSIPIMIYHLRHLAKRKSSDEF